MARTKAVLTPLMKQYYRIKDKHPDAILLFRVGDFYETFEEDAVKAAGILGITLTKRANGAASFVDLAGFPHHAIDNYLPKLVRAGQRVAICEQLEDPKKTKKLVKRGITELVTPGVSFNDNVLEHKENNFLASIHFDKNIAGIAFLDISTGEFLTSQGTIEYVDKLLANFQPKEVLFQKDKEKFFVENFGSKFYTFPVDDWIFSISSAKERLLQQFETASLKGFGVQNLDYGIVAAGSILHYLDFTKHSQIDHITTISRIDEDTYMWLDRFTVQNLELFTPIQAGGKALYNVLDATVSPMGGRLLKRWMSLPLKNVHHINERHEIVDFFCQNQSVIENVDEKLRLIGDLERIISKVAVNRVNPREIVQLKNALFAIEPIKKICEKTDCKALHKISDQLNPCEEIRSKISKEVLNNPPVLISKGNVISKGVSSKLDDLREIAYSGKDYLSKLQQKESERTGISSLKIAFNNVFGYYIEVRNTHKDKVPPEWIRKQTLVNAERYITEELKDYEEKILTAEEKITALEVRIFNDLISSIAQYVSTIQLNANMIARTDCLLSLAKIAIQNNYSRPEINDSDELIIRQGRHPVIEKLLPIDDAYVANDVFLDNDKQQIIIVTGPNMAGKSAFLRQSALIVLMTQIGSFVPAKTAQIGFFDKIFTRVGASDNISLGESTFMVEMNEAASILNNLSERSLILFDELGRGTSTYDGISIAWSVVEYIHEHPKFKAKTLFATHYHELNEMEKSFNRIKNYNVSVREIGDKIVFLRKLVAGGSNHSFGIQVARMAGMPKSVVKRAGEILLQLEKGSDKKHLEKPIGDLAQTREGYQLSFFQLDDPVLLQIRKKIDKLDINQLTPIEALNILYEIRKLSGG